MFTEELKPIVHYESHSSLRNLHLKPMLSYLVVISLWFTIDFIAVGIIFDQYHLGGNLYINGLIVGSSDLLSSILMGFISNNLGRRFGLILSVSLTLVGNIAIFWT